MCDSPFLSFKFVANGKKFKTIPWPLAANHQPLKIFPSGPQLLYNRGNESLLYEMKGT